MYVNGEAFGRMFDTYTQGITYLGMYEAGDTVTVRLVPEYGMLRLYEPLFYTEDLPCCKAPVTPAARLCQTGRGVVLSFHRQRHRTGGRPADYQHPLGGGLDGEGGRPAVPTRRAVGELMAVDLAAGAIRWSCATARGACGGRRADGGQRPAGRAVGILCAQARPHGQRAGRIGKGTPCRSGAQGCGF